MPKRIDLLVIEDDEGTCLAYEEYCKDREDVFLIGTSAYIDEALKVTEEFKPNAVVVDLELKKSQGSGFEYFIRMNEIHLEVKPYFLVVTNNISETTYAVARNLGADFIIAKAKPDYSVAYVVNFLRSIIDSIPDMKPQHETSSRAIKKRIEEDYNRRMVKKIGMELDIIGINPRFKGRNYLRDAIEMICQKEQPYICNELGKKYGKTPASVERAMQNAIDRAWNSTDITTLEEHYRAYINPKKGVPTLTEFIYYYANKVKGSMGE